MAQLLVRNLDEEVKERLRRRAALRGHSLEAEAREILRAAAEDVGLAPGSGLGTRVARRFAGLGLGAELPELRGKAARPADLGTA
ncbi:MAG: plasmid stabilization protein [Acetobacteraceae bacterium]|nr:plasmid stabilization protein [Acetobacteraceae bacterium]